jgi:hypothetical protein
LEISVTVACGKLSTLDGNVCGRSAVAHDPSHLNPPLTPDLPTMTTQQPDSQESLISRFGNKRDGLSPGCKRGWQPSAWPSSWITKGTPASLDPLM